VGCTGQAEHLPAEVGEQAAVVERTELGPAGSGGGVRLRRGAVDERQLLGFACPCRQFERESGEVDLGDLGRPVRLAGAVLEPCSTAGSTRRAGSSGPPGPLVGRCATRRDVVSRVIPVRTSNRGARARPLSTTTRTPSTVSDVSAMSVVNTTRRRPGRRSGAARVLLGERERARERERRRPRNHPAQR
jgi:hypothetical protein